MEIVRTSRHNYVKYRDCWLFKKLEFKNWKVSRNSQWLCRILLSKPFAFKTYLPWKSFERVAHKNTLLPFFMGMKEKFVFFFCRNSFQFILTESETMEAQALYDFNARSSREVNFRKGETILLEKQVSNDWWKGSVNGKHGLIPDKYIMLKMRQVYWS